MDLLGIIIDSDAKLVEHHKIKRSTLVNFKEIVKMSNGDSILSSSHEVNQDCFTIGNIKLYGMNLISRWGKRNNTWNDSTVNIEIIRNDAHFC